MKVEVITRYEKDKPTIYSVDGGKTWLTKQYFKQKISAIKRPLYNNKKLKNR